MDIKELTKLANHLDSKGLQKEADVIDSFVKEAGALATVGAWIAGRLSDETLIDIANKLPSERLAELAKKMDKEKQKDVIKRLVSDPEMQATAMEALGLPAGLAGAAGELLGELGGISGTGAATEAGALGESPLGELQGLFELGSAKE